MRYWLLPSVIAFLGGLPAWAEEGPSFDCAQATSSAEELVCADPDLAALDRRLSERFAAAMAAAEGLDAGADEAVGTLRATQRGWIGGRDECWKADDPAACVAEAYLTREAELVALWLLEPPTASGTFICGGTPANELTADFFDTELPGVRVEYGDSVAAGWLTRAASGSRYELPFGRMLWTKGEEALFVWPEGTEQECRRAE